MARFMNELTLEVLKERLELGEQLLAGKDTMFEPQDLPGRYGRVVKAIDSVLHAIQCEAVMAGGWAVWRHGFFARMTQDIDIVLPSNRVDEFLRAAAVSGFIVLSEVPGRWRKLQHKETKVQVDILPEGGRPGTRSNLAPTTIPHPSALGASGSVLRYIKLPRLIELKLAAGRPRDDADVAELMRVQPEEADLIRKHLASVHPRYVEHFDRLVERAREQEDM
jgi:hypothetical protein